jgi:hypothetical protein
VKHVETRKVVETSLRNQLRRAVLVLFTLGLHGSNHQVEQEITADNRKQSKDARKAVKAPKNIGIQLSQVRGELFTAVGIDPGEVNGRLRKDQIASIEKQLATKRVQNKVDKEIAALGYDPAELRATAKSEWDVAAAA